MLQGNARSPGASVTPLGRKSWTAYISATLIAVVFSLLLGPMIWYFSHGLSLLVVGLVFAILVYHFILIRSYCLYLDDMGVWFFSGVLPWKKGVQGVKWRDLDEAVYFQTLWSWLFESYSIRIGHRFTKSSEMLLSHMAYGEEAVMAINSKHQELLRAHQLD